MARWMVAGIVSGAVVSTVVLAAASLLSSESLPGDTPPRPPETSGTALPEDVFPFEDPAPVVPRADRNPRVPPGARADGRADREPRNPEPQPAAVPTAAAGEAVLRTPRVRTEATAGPTVGGPVETVARRAVPLQPSAPDRGVAPRLPDGAAPIAQRPTVGEPVASRLPQVGDAASPRPLAAPPQIGWSVAPAIAENAASYAAEPDRPAISILLRHEGDMTPKEGVGALGFPVTVVIDPEDEGAAAAMRAYRAAGHEVALGGALPRGATAADAEVAWSSWIRAIPEAVAVVETAEGRLGGGRPEALETVVAAAARTGHGVVTWPRGLNAALGAAERLGVPGGLIFFDIDDGGAASAEAMRRALDRAAFRASREDGIIVIGSTRPETIAALEEWGRADGDRRVQPVPLSALLTR